MEPLWKFTPLVPQPRRDALLATAAFGEIVERIRCGLVEFIEMEPRRNPPSAKCRRAFFRVYVPERDYDAFFNSPVGYRAQFCIGLENGEECNRQIVSALTPRCLASVRTDAADSGKELIEASLRGAGAKLWISEADLANLDGVYIDHKPWVVKCQAATSGTLTEQAARSLAFAGVLAPVGTCLESQGWLDHSRRDRVARSGKGQNRSREIHDYGFT